MTRQDARVPNGTRSPDTPPHGSDARSAAVRRVLGTVLVLNSLVASLKLAVGIRTHALAVLGATLGSALGAVLVVVDGSVDVPPVVGVVAVPVLPVLLLLPGATAEVPGATAGSGCWACCGERSSGLPLPNVARLYGRSCLDWTERRMHLGGPLGVALTAAMLEAGWLRPLPRSRALQPSADGLRRLGLLGVPLD